MPRPPVRLLHAGHDHAVGRPAQRQPPPHRARRSGSGSRATSAAAPATTTSSRASCTPPSTPATAPDEVTAGARVTATAERPAAEIGKDRRRKEDQRLITGRTRWTDNITLPGMLHLAMVRSPFAHATIVSIDTSAAEEPRPTSSPSSPARTSARSRASTPTPGRSPPTRSPRTTSRCRATGWPSPVRSSPSSWPAPPPRRVTPPSSSTWSTTSCPPRSTSRRQREDKVLAHPDLGTNKSAFWQLDSARPGTGGDVDEAIAKARADGIVIEREFRQQRLIPAFMEPRSTVVRPHRRADHDVVGDPDPAHPAVPARRHDRRTRVEDPGHRARRRRRLRRQAPVHARGVDHLVRRAAPGQAVQVHRDPVRVADGRPPRPRPVAEADAGRRPRTARSPASRSTCSPTSAPTSRSSAAASRCWAP